MNRDRRRFVAVSALCALSFGAAPAMARIAAPTEGGPAATTVSHMTTGTSHKRRSPRVTHYRAAANPSAG